MLSYTSVEMPLADKNRREGHPTLGELTTEQGLTFPRDPRELIGGFWPEDESIDDFLQLLRESRGHLKTDPAA